MNLSAKHQQTVITHADFTGGLNTTTVPEMITENQMADCVNMEFNKTTGALETCCGTATIFQVPDDINIGKVFYDEINNEFLFTDKDSGYIYVSKLVDINKKHQYDRKLVGVLTGKKIPTAVMWDNGLLIASGGSLQYWDGQKITLIQPELSSIFGVVAKAKRFQKNTYYYEGDYCWEYYTGATKRSFFRCKIAHRSESDASNASNELSNWQEINLNDNEDSGINTDLWEYRGEDIITAEFPRADKTQNYKIGDIIYDSYWGYYYCIKEHSNLKRDENLSSDKNDELNRIELTHWINLEIVNYEFGNKYVKNQNAVLINGVYFLCKNTHIANTAPSICNGVFIKNGRVYVWHEYTLQCSSVGDALDWNDSSDTDSSSKSIDIGYKEGEKEQAYIAGACALSSDIVIIKNDGKVYRLAGNYPDWELKEVARNITCLNPECYVAVQDNVFITGREGIFALQTTTDYGDVQPTNIANGIVSLLGILSIEKSYMRFIPQLNQIWIAGQDNRFICYDLTFKAFFQRRFNSSVNDVCHYKSYCLLARNHKITELMEGIYHDEMYSSDESEMEWYVEGKSHTSLYDFLLKRIRIGYVPLIDTFTTAELITAKDKIHIDLPGARITSTLIYDDDTRIATDNRQLFPMNTQFVTKWMVARDITFGIKLKGRGSAVMINRIDSTVANV